MPFKMPVHNTEDCRACLTVCSTEKETFDSLKDVFVELTSLQVREAIELPNYLCNKCAELLTQFKSFKQTCIESDQRLQNAMTKTTCNDADLFVELTTPPIKRIRKPSKRAVESTSIQIKQECPNELEDPYEIHEIKQKTTKTKKKLSRKKRKTVADVKKDGEIATKAERGDTSDDSEEWNEPLNKLVKLSGPESDKSKNQRLFNCTVSKCQRSFLTEEMLETHLKTHKGIDCTICDICGRPLTSVTNMIRHRKTHLSLEERSFKCNVCNKVMLHENSLKYHMRTHDSIKSFVCDMCGMGFGTSWGLKSHSQTHTTERTYKCEKCPSSYKTYGALYGHVKSKHENKGDTTVQCDICGQSLLSKDSLFSHCRNMHTVYTTTENLYQCIQCDVKCKTMQSLKTHVRLHTGERKYKCPLCPKSYAHSTILKRHSYTHTGERPVQCQECGKGFLQKYALNVHMKVHGKEVQKPKKRTNGTSSDESSYSDEGLE